MKKVLSAILSLCLSFSLIVPFSFSAKADIYPQFPDVSGNIALYISNFNPYSTSSSYAAFVFGFVPLENDSFLVYYNSNNGLLYSFDIIQSYSKTNLYGTAYTVDNNGVSNVISTPYYVDFTSSGIYPIYFRSNFTEYINLTNYQLPSWSDKLPYRFYSDTFMSDAFTDRFTGGFVLPSLSDSVGVTHKNPGAMSCSYNEATGVISCTDPNTDYSFNISFPSVSINGSLSSSSYVRLYVSSYTILFDDYYSGYLELNSSLSGFSVDGGVINGNYIFITDAKEVTIYESNLVSSGAVPTINFDINAFYLFNSRFDSSFFLNIGLNILDNLDMVTEGYDDLVKGTDDLKGTNQELENNLNDYNQIEGNIQTDFDDALNKVDTNQGLFNMQDFASTANWVSVQLTNLYNSHDSIKYATGFSLIFGLSLMIIGRRWH